VYLTVHDDRDAAETSRVDEEFGTKTLTIKSDAEGVLQVRDARLEHHAMVSIEHIDRKPVMLC
jgi:hypothetical protein